jgi:lipid-A-disaccharide synthase
MTPAAANGVAVYTGGFDPWPMPRLLVSCGEPSGDVYGGELVRALRARVGALDVFGLGGDHLCHEGARLVAHVREVAVVGLLEVLTHLRHLRGVFTGILESVDRERPDVAVLIDYPDFNLRLASELRRRGVPVVYYVSPQIWAWRGGRIRSIRETVARMLVIFPFEEALYRDAGVPVTFVGHPLVDLVSPVADRPGVAASLGLDPGRPVIALLPGSRPKEVGHNLPPLVGAVDRLVRARPELQLVLAAAPSLDQAALQRRIAGRPIRVVAGRTHDVLGAADLAVVASGTATVEAALLRTPMVVVYRLSPLTYALGRPFVRVPHFAMVNLIAGREVVPEIIQREFTAERVAAEALSLLSSPARIRQMQSDLDEVRERLGLSGASERAADVVAAYLVKKLDTIETSM